MTKIYKLTVTQKQLRLIQYAADLMSRIQMGQWREIEEHLPLQKPIDYEELHTDLRIIGSILSKHMIKNIDGWSSSLGIGNENLPESNAILYDLKKTIEHKLAWERAVEQGIIDSETSERKFPEMLTCDYDSPMKWGNEELAKIERVDT